MSELLVETRKMIIGIEEPIEVIIYPLSFAKQKKFAAKIADILTSLATEDQEALSNIDMVNKILQLIEDNIVEIGEMVIKSGIDLDKISNEQVVDLCTIVYEMNYEGSIKKAQALVQKVKEVWTKTR